MDAGRINFKNLMDGIPICESLLHPNKIHPFLKQMTIVVVKSRCVDANGDQTRIDTQENLYILSTMGPSDRIGQLSIEEF